MIRGYPAEAIRAAEAPALAAGEPLMLRAADAVAEAVRLRLAGETDPAVLVLVGGGNNGGDGLYAAAVLASVARVSVALARSDVHAGGLDAARAAGVEILDVGADPSGRVLAAAAEDAHVWVDALAGIGVRGALRGAAAEIVEVLTAVADGAPVPPVVIAVDIPSGVDADTGAAAGPVLAADLTVTFGGAKAGLLLPPGDRLAGEVQVVALGLDEDLAAQMPTVSRLLAADAADLWPVPGFADHKYTRGVLGVLAGSAGYPGAAVLCTGGALRTGCGMVRYLGPERAEQLVLSRWPEVVPGSGRVQAYVVGPGIGPDDDARRAEIAATIETAVRDAVGLVVDAGALDLLPPGEQLAGVRVVLTPHAGELATLLGARGEQIDREAVEQDPRRWAARAAELTGATVLLKGATTVVVAPDGETYAQADGTGWLATAGSGDVLAGILGALLAGLPDVSVARVAALAALVHGRAGRAASNGAPIVATDVVDALPATIRALLG
ncbi:NAD(P)H-hydrate dehydratase [Pseudactinotalea terrae]|uniref:NAD(P)H-hydrate dehydratase n=1 Tax=Pseudactinotalea terrae TaxID=1743262 RepID=UPI0012E1317D|nr:NAD(P)H-hydrate dehydratase [Pseudactinotalea terrae]